MSWPVVLCVAIGSFLLRAAMLARVDRGLPRPLAARLIGIAPAALGALLASTFRHHVDLAAAVACAAAVVAVRRTGNVSHAFLVGFPLLWLTEAMTH